MNVYFNNDDNFCDEYGCTVSGYVNDYIEGELSLSLCQVQETGEVYFDKESFKSWIALSFELPEVCERPRDIEHELPLEPVRIVSAIWAGWHNIPDSPH